MAKNIFLTTLSTFDPSRAKVNYYYYKNPDGSIRFYTGIHNQEAGAKYILSTVPIDKIVVIGSEATKSGPSYDFFTARIKEFLNHDTSFRDMVARGGLSTIRKPEEVPSEELEKIVKDNLVTLAKNPSTDFISRLKDTVAAINEAIDKRDADKNALIEQARTELEKYEQQIEQIAEHQKVNASFSPEDFLNKIKKQVLDALNISDEKKRRTQVSSLFTELIEKNNARSLSLVLKSSNSKKELIAEQEKNSALSKTLSALDKDYAKYYLLTSSDAKVDFMSSVQDTSSDIEFVFVDETEAGQDNFAGLVAALHAPDEEVNLYVDIQGGSRTSNYGRNTVLSILTNLPDSPFQIKKIIASDFRPGNVFNQIQDETKRYRILDLAAGMNALIRYGRADIFEKYCDDLGIGTTSPFRKLVEHMTAIDHALSVCNPTELTKAIENLSKFFKKESNKVVSPEFNNVYQVLYDGIKSDYGALLEHDTPEPIEIIRWALNKRFFQQSLTFIESVMPINYFQKRWLTHVTDIATIYEDLGLINSYTTKENNIFDHLYKKLRDSGLERDPNNSAIITAREMDLKAKLFSHYFGIQVANADTLTTEMSQQKYSYIENPQSLVTENNFSVWLNSELEKIIKELIELAASGENEPRFIFLYIKFYVLKDLFNDSNSIDWKLLYASEFFFLMANKEEDTLDCMSNDVSFTVLKCTGSTKRYRSVQINNPNYFKITLHQALDTPDNRKKAEELFLLHDAIKSERNTNNHASVSMLRLPISVLKKALQLYVKRYDEIQAIVNSNS